MSQYSPVQHRSSLPPVQKSPRFKTAIRISLHQSNSHAAAVCDVLLMSQLSSSYSSPVTITNDHHHHHDHNTTPANKVMRTRKDIERKRRRKKEGGGKKEEEEAGGRRRKRKEEDEECKMIQNDTRLIPAGKYSLPHWIAAYVPHHHLFTWKVLLRSEPMLCS